MISIVAVVMFTGLGAGIRRRANLKTGQEYIDEFMGDGADEWTGTGEAPKGKYSRSMITISLIVSQSDWQAGGAASPTTPVYKMFYEQPTADSSGEDLTVAGEDVTIKASNDGVIWIDAYGGTDFYLLPDEIEGSNSEVSQIVHEDYDADGKMDLLIECDLSAFLMGPQDFKPSFTLSMPLLDLDVTSLADNNPADITSIGTSETVTNIEWVLSGVTAEDGLVISELYFVTNSTRQGEDIRFEELYFGGQWTVEGQTSWNSPIDYTYGDYTAYYIKAPDNNDPLSSGTVMAFRDTNKADTFDVSVNARMTLETGNNILVDLYVTCVSPDGTVTEVNDQVMLSA